MAITKMVTIDFKANAKVEVTIKLLKWVKSLSMLVTIIERIDVSFEVRISFTNLKIVKKLVAM